jgi:predicted transcriptional regulator
VNDNKVAISVTISNSVHQALRERAQAQDRSVSWLLNHAAEEWLAKQPTVPGTSNMDRAQLSTLKK